ncbi:MAG: acetyl-CoA carboxylase carboxyl transferase subunit beta, partial [Acidobacteriota bacterium]|nr:acetyl-CoA carboxylase carboxyl transferase subunit beta [Acidobacteriota bacterium]
MSWFKREEANPEKPAQPEAPAERTVKTEGLWQKCEGCREIIWKKDLETTQNVCPKCGAHFRIDARARLLLLLDPGSFEQHDEALASSDPLNFVDQKSYRDRLTAMQAATSLNDALVSGSGTLAGRKVHICAMEPKFIGGSMGCVMGEKI